MSKPQSERTHKKNVDKQNSNRSAADIRAAKNAGVKARNAERKAKRIAAIAARPKLTPTQQLAALDRAGLAAVKERKKLQKKLQAAS